MAIRNWSSLTSSCSQGVTECTVLCTFQMQIMNPGREKGPIWRRLFLPNLFGIFCLDNAFRKANSSLLAPCLIQEATLL